jgi:hypothetical protein
MQKTDRNLQRLHQRSLLNLRNIGDKMNAVMKYEAICGELLIDPALPFEDVEFITFFKGLKGKGLKPPEHWVLIKKYLEENY